jgi:glycosyltransferase involved in cell wall biosynthesis
MTGADRVIAASEFMAEQIAARFAVEPARIRTVRPGLDAKEFDPERVRGHRVLALAERWGIAPDERVVMVLPGSGPQDRGHIFLLQAVARMAWNDFLVLFVGGLEPGTPQVEELLAMLRTTGLGARVRFGGDTDDLPAALALADLVVLPATEPDPSGLAAAAAQAMGKPVIVANSGALGESVLPAATGWLVPADDPDELARALELALAMDEEARARLAARARTFVLEAFDMEAMCARTLAVYRELVRPAELPVVLQDGRTEVAAKSPA